MAVDRVAGTGRKWTESLVRRTRDLMNTHTGTTRRFVLALVLTLSALITAACGTLVGAGVGAAGGAVYDIVH